MPEIKLQNAYRVDIIESERGWRQKIDETKYKYVVHAEMNVIYNASYSGVSLDGADLYGHGLPVCSECAKGIIQVGIKRVFVRTPPTETLDRWVESWARTVAMFEEAGVEHEWIMYE